MPYQKPPIGAKLNYGHPLANGLVGCWLFNEGSGDTIWDYSGNGNHGKILNMSSMTSARGWDGNSHGATLAYDGSDTFKVDCGLASNLRFLTEDFTICVWASSGSAHNGEMVCNGFGYAVNKGYSFLYLASPQSVWLSTGSTQFGHNITFADKKMRFFAGTKVGTAGKIYVDGVLGTPGTLAASVGTYTADNLLFGERGDAASWNLNGRMSPVYIYKRALSAAEIAYLNAFPYCMFDNPYPIYWGLGVPPPPSGFTPRIYMIM